MKMWSKSSRNVIQIPKQANFNPVAGYPIKYHLQLITKLVWKFRPKDSIFRVQILLPARKMHFKDHCSDPSAPCAFPNSLGWGAQEIYRNSGEEQRRFRKSR